MSFPSGLAPEMGHVDQLVAHHPEDGDSRVIGLVTAMPPIPDGIGHRCQSPLRLLPPDVPARDTPAR